MASALGGGYTRGGKGPKCPAIIILRRIWRRGSRRRASPATRRCDPQGRQTNRESNGKVRCFSDDQTAGRGGRPALLHLLSHISGDRHHDLPAEWRHARTCPDPRESRIAPNERALRPHSRGALFDEVKGSKSKVRSQVAHGRPTLARKRSPA